ncbi:hypothetical protein BX070DRAFT_197739, partial [Coemansia spiralis]
MHNFVVTTFTSPTYCEYCSGFLWGVAKQGVRCSKCKATAHKKCALKAVTQCTGDRGLATLIPSVSPISRSSFHDSPEPTSPASNNEATVTDGYIAQLDGMFWQQLDKEIKINTLVSAQSEQPLSLFQTLPANFMQFTAKLAPLSFIHRLVKDVVFWRKPNHSVLAMAVYSMYCLRPNLLLATPLALLIAYIVFNYFNSGYWNKSGSLDAVDTKNRVSVSATLFGVAGFGSAKYTDNVHTTQIMTGTYVRMYDWVVTHNYLVDWSQPDEAWHILFMCICAQMVLLVIVYWVPWYLLFLVSGNLALL